MNALCGVRVVEWATEIAGPYCTKLFADLGAEVIKIEAPDGDPFRRRTSGDRSDADALFKFLNAGKRSVVYTSLPDVEALIVSADVFVDSLGPGALDREALLRRAPHLVIVALSPYGLTGPYRDRPATEFTIQAESGTLALRGRPTNRPFKRVAESSNGSWPVMPPSGRSARCVGLNSADRAKSLTARCWRRVTSPPADSLTSTTSWPAVPVDRAGPTG